MYLYIPVYYNSKMQQGGRCEGNKKGEKREFRARQRAKFFHRQKDMVEDVGNNRLEDDPAGPSGRKQSAGQGPAQDDNQDKNT